MSHRTQDGATRDGVGRSLTAAVSDAIVRLLREYTGRGPMKSRTVINDNVVIVLLEQTLTKGEESLVRSGRSEQVLGIRREFQEAMRAESTRLVGQLTGRTVTAMLSANHLDPDTAAEIFILDGAPDYASQPWLAPEEPT